MPARMARVGQGGGAGQQGEGEAGAQSGGHEAGGDDGTAVGVAGGGGLEVHADAGDDADEYGRDDNQEEQVDRVADVVGQEAAGVHEGGHRGTTKWLMISTVRPAARRSATRPQNFW